MGIILTIPLPQILQAITTITAIIAIGQLALQLSIAVEERVRPIAMIIGPVTIGGKNFITLAGPNTLKSIESTTYKRPAHATPIPAYAEKFPTLLFAHNSLTAAYPPRNANDEPRNAGTLRLVKRWNKSVPIPAKRSVAETLSPVIRGTRTVAPNIANMC